MEYNNTTKKVYLFYFMYNIWYQTAHLMTEENMKKKIHANCDLQMTSMVQW